MVQFLFFYNPQARNHIYLIINKINLSETPYYTWLAVQHGNMIYSVDTWTDTYTQYTR